MKETRNYNPADYAALKGEAKSMDRKELEEFFVKTKDNRHTKVSVGIAMLIAVLVVVFSLVLIATSIANENTNIALEDKVVIIEKELCADYKGEIVLQEKSTYWGRELIVIDCNK
jgi:hypothetical protein